MRTQISVAAVVFRDREGRVLTVRKQGTDAFILPGGKPEANEDFVQAALREVAEELDVVLHAHELEALGQFQVSAANEAGMRIYAEVFATQRLIEAKPHAELEEIRWVSPARSEEHERQAPLNLEYVFPKLLSAS